MSDQPFLEPVQRNEIVFYPENEVPLCDVSDLIVFDDSSNNFDCDDPQYKTIEGDPDALLTSTEIKLETSIGPPFSELFKCNSKLDQKIKPARRWKQKEILIKTLESQFKVLMWSKDDTEDEENAPVNILSKPKPETETKKLPQSQKKRQPLQQTSAKTVPSHDKPPYTCTFKSCQKSFKDFSTLRKHMHIHGPRTFICAECGKSFVESSKLKRHHLVHTGEKPFQCWFEGCGKRFSLDFNLRTHVRIHTGVRPFACPVVECRKSFAQSTNLKSHMITHAKAKNRNYKKSGCVKNERG